MRELSCPGRSIPWKKQRTQLLLNLLGSQGSRSLGCLIFICRSSSPVACHLKKLHLSDFRAPDAAALFSRRRRRRRGSLLCLHGDMSSVPFGGSGLYTGFHGHEPSQLGASTSRALLDSRTEEEELADAADAAKRKGDRGGKAAAALKSHSEAERRRRERINAHLATLRTMVPYTDKMDKAALLAEVIAHVKRLKTNAARVSSHCPVPADADDVAVELVRDDDASPRQGTPGLIKATLSCDDGAGIFADVKHALRPLRLRVVSSEVTTLGGRVRFTFLLVPSCGGDDVTVGSVRQALQSVLDKASAPLEFAPRASLLSKRRRVSNTFESSSSSS